MRKNYIFILFIVFITGCSQYKNGPTSKAWHNLNAKYNALLIAREDYSVAQDYVLNNTKENFGSVLPIFRKIDSTKLDTAKLFLVDAIKKSSIVAERHSNSKYLDEAYLLLGKSRLAKQEIFNAIETFKYVNTKSKSASAKAEALIWLIRAYIENGDMATANQVSDILKSQKLSKSNKSLFLVTKAYYHQIEKEDAVAAVFLEEALKSMKKGREKARFHFIAGQFYDQLNQPVIARKNYRQVLKNKPDYDLEFNANLGLLMNQSLAKNTNLEFGKMLEDRKNQDLKSKIYFKMGETEMKKNNLESALDFFHKSVNTAEDDLQQKAFAYKAIGDLYFDKKLDYEMAGIYYDSTLITIPKNAVDGNELGQKAMFLNDFIKYKRAYDFEDSLQKLAALNPAQLDYKLEQIIIDKKNSQKKIIENDPEKSVLKSSNVSNLPKDFKRWMLYDPTESIKAKNEFVRLWGNRPLEDNWRRSEKTMGSFSLKIEKINLDSAGLAAIKKPTQVTENEDTEKKEIEQEKKELMKKIPTTSVQKIASKRKQEEALFQIAKIYKLKFNDEAKAKINFNHLVNDFPRSVYEPEALYFLSIMEKDTQNNPFTAKLISTYPNSSFARQLKKGSIKLSKDRETEVLSYYASAFKLYEKSQFQETLDMLDKGLNEYVGSQIEDKMAMLRILTLKKIGPKDQYQISLTDFVRSYPTSDLLFKARELLAVLN